MNNKELVDELIKNNLYRAINTLGIEATQETIESIANPALRAKLRIGLYKILNKGV